MASLSASFGATSSREATCALEASRATRRRFPSAAGTRAEAKIFVNGATRSRPNSREQKDLYDKLSHPPPWFARYKLPLKPLQLCVTVYRYHSDVPHACTVTSTLVNDITNFSAESFSTYSVDVFRTSRALAARAQWLGRDIPAVTHA